MERNENKRRAEIARLVTEQMQDQYQVQAGIVTSGMECTTGLHYEVGLRPAGDRVNSCAAVDIMTADKAYHGGSSVVDRVDRANF